MEKFDKFVKELNSPSKEGKLFSSLYKNIKKVDISNEKMEKICKIVER